MCPLCLATSGFYIAGGVSAGAVTGFFATKLLRKPADPAATTAPPETGGDDDATTDDRIGK